MKIQKIAFLSISLLAGTVTAFAQNLMEVGNIKVSKDEFLKMYENNSIKGKVNYSEDAIRDYLNYYTLYRMKLQEARELQMDTVTTVKREIEHYKKQLAHSYLKDKTINERLAKEAYQRLKEEVEVAHIFIAFPMNNDQRSKNIFRQKIDSVYNLVNTKKMTFEEAAKTFSMDASTANNGGYLGYITALQTEHTFEEKFYNTKPGTISEPFASSQGFHIVKVLSRRPNRGQVQVQQILISAPLSAGAEKDKEAKAKASRLVAELRKGASFDQYVATYSEDRFSKNNKGELAPFRSGDVSKALEDAAFGLKKPGDISDPVKSEFGYHILRLVKKIPVGSYEEESKDLMRKVEQDSRSIQAHEAKQEEIRAKVNLVEHKEVLAKIKTAAKEHKEKFTLYNEQQQYDPNAVLLSVAGKPFYARDFVTYFESVNRGRPLLSNTDKLIDDIYSNYTNNVINDVRYEQLYAENKDFRNMVNDYNDAILIYEMNSSRVWKRANDDTLGLDDFYQKHKSKYVWQPGFEGRVFQSKERADLEKLLAKISQGTEPFRAYEELAADQANRVNIAIQDGRYEFQKFNATAAGMQENKPSAIISSNGMFTVIVPRKLYPAPVEKSLEEAKGFVVSDYQEYLEKEWSASLKKKYPVKVNEAVLKTIFKK